MNDFESVSKKVYGSSLFSRTASRPHQIVFKSLCNVDAGLAKPAVFMASHAVGNVNWPERNILFQSGILHLDSFETPLSEELNLLFLTQMRHLNKPLGLNSKYLNIVENVTNSSISIFSALASPFDRKPAL